MPECAFEIKLATKDTDKLFKLVALYRDLAEMRGEAQTQKRRVRLLAAFGEDFAEIHLADLSSNDDILNYKRFLDSQVLKDLDLYRRLITIKTTNKKRIWQDTWNAENAELEICPDKIDFRTYQLGSSGYDWNHLDLFYNSNEAAGFYIVEVSSNDEYEDDYDE